MKKNRSETKIIHQKAFDHDVLVRAYSKNGRITLLKGFAVYSDSTDRINNYIASRKVFNENNLDEDIACIVNRVNNSFTINKPSKLVIDFTELNKESDLYQAYSEFRNNYDFIAGWKEASTYRQFISKFERRILPFLSNFPEDKEFTIADSNVLRQKLKDKIESDKRSAKESQTTDRNIATLLTQTEHFLEVLHELYDEIYEFPTFKLSEGIRPKIRNTYNEQIKMLDNAVRRKFIKLIEADIQSHPRLVFSSVCMLYGVRTAEAAAENTADLKYIYSIPILSVFNQENDLKRDPLLKNHYSYRVNPISTWGESVLQECIELIGEMEENSVMVSASDLNKYVIKKLKEAGVDDSFLNSANQERIGCGDSKMKNPNEVTAYILRRDFASRAKNICGFTSEEIDHYLGHEVCDPQNRIDFMSEKTLKSVAMKLERFVFNDKKTKNPGYTPVDVSKQLIPEMDFPNFKITSSKKVRIKIDIESSEAGEQISIISSPGSFVNYEIRKKIRINHNIRHETIGSEENSH